MNFSNRANPYILEKKQQALQNLPPPIIRRHSAEPIKTGFSLAELDDLELFRSTGVAKGKQGSSGYIHIRNNGSKTIVMRIDRDLLRPNANYISFAYSAKRNALVLMPATEANETTLKCSGKYKEVVAVQKIGLRFGIDFKAKVAKDYPVVRCEKDGAEAYVVFLD